MGHKVSANLNVNKNCMYKVG